MKGAKKLVKGYVHEDDFFIIHDALVLMTVKEKIIWIKEKNYLHHWLLPMNRFQDGTPYDGLHVEYSPELMPIDNSFNRDIFHS